MEIVRASTLLRRQGRKISKAIRRSLNALGLSVAEGDSNIISVVVGDADKTMRASRLLNSQGILVGSIRPPTVPRETSRLRVSLKATLTSKDVERILAAFGQVAKEIA